MRAGVLAVVICLSGCQSTPADPQLRPPPPPPVPTLPKVEAKREKIPSWALETLPEDHPREYSGAEAVNLSCRRLNIIRHANCVNALRKAYNEGEDVDPAKCKLDLDKGCNHP